MRKSVITVAVGGLLWTPDASGQTILQKTDWRAKSFETFLPPPISVPRLDLDLRTKPPKRDLPIPLDEAMTASIELAKRRDGGHVPQ